jgi:hypothetical protein
MAEVGPRNKTTVPDSGHAGGIPEPARRRRSPAAERALAEAAARRAEIDARVEAMPKEHGGRSGPEPVRYGDWEIKGIASDFS